LARSTLNDPAITAQPGLDTLHRVLEGPEFLMKLTAFRESKRSNIVWSSTGRPSPVNITLVEIAK
jgi:hypothetical protein